MKIVVIGGSGHIGSYLIPRLVEAGYDVINVSRSLRKPYLQSQHWSHVQQIVCDRTEEDKNRVFAKRIRSLNADIVIDNICFTPTSATSLIEELKGHVRHFLSTGTIWVHGYGEIIPTIESVFRKPFGEYGINKNEIEKILMQAAQTQNFPATVIHPGHIVGKGWPCLNPQGNFNLKVFQTIIDGNELSLANLGLESVHHVHADDVAQIFQKAIEKPDKAIGQCFHVVSSGALTLRAYAEEAYRWFGHIPKLRFMPLADLENYIDHEDYQQTMEHVTRSPCMSVEKARAYLGYDPNYTSLQACQECVEWMIKNNRLHISNSLRNEEFYK